MLRAVVDRVVDCSSPGKRADLVVNGDQVQDIR
jgi:hypothetical protein